jgi:hypothetical protein
MAASQRAAPAALAPAALPGRGAAGEATSQAFAAAVHSKPGRVGRRDAFHSGHGVYVFPITILISEPD